MLNHDICPETDPRVFDVGLSILIKLLKFYPPSTLDTHVIFRQNPMLPAVKFKTSTEPVKILLTHGLDPNAMIEGLCPIAHSIINSNHLVTKFLLDWGVDLTIKTEPYTNSIYLNQSVPSLTRPIGVPIIELVKQI